MKSIFKASVILSGSSVISLLVSLVSAKVMALYLQPAGYGYYGLLQSFVGLAALAAGMGMATGLVRLGAGAAAQGDQQTMANLQAGAWVVFAGMSVISFAACYGARNVLSQWVLGTYDQGTTIVLMAIPLILTVANNIQVGTLNAHHRVAALAQYGVANTVLCAVASIAAILIWGVRGVVPGIVAGGFVSYALSHYLLRRDVKHLDARPSRQGALKAARDLFQFGGPFAASAFVGTGVQLALPMIVLHLLNTESVGYYKAALAISVGYLGFLVTAMGQDYFPRVSAVKDQPEALGRLVNEQHRLVLLLSVPVILGMLALVPVLVPLVYTRKFIPTVEILEWQLIGDLFKFSSWTLSFLILARSSSTVYFLTEFGAGVMNLFLTWLAVRFFGLPGLGIGFLATHVCYYFLVRIVIRRNLNLSWTAQNKRVMATAVLAAVLIRVLPATTLAGFRMAIALLFATISTIWSLYTVWHEVGRPASLSSLRTLAQKI